MLFFWFTILMSDILAKWVKHKSCPIPSYDRFCQILVDSCVIVNLIKVECDSPMYRY